MTKTTDANVSSISQLETPNQYIERLPLKKEQADVVLAGRRNIRQSLHGNDDRLTVIVGPCSVHDINAAQEYADRLARLAERVKGEMIVVMRTYFEKPRTTLGWKGLISDPDLNGTFNVPKGLNIARKFLISIAERELPAAIEWLDPLTPQYLGDLISWGAIGARTTESQTHRQLASGLSSPIGFKNGTGGNRHSVQIAADAVVAACSPHAFMGSDTDGKISVVITKGNPDTHIVLRGGLGGTNYGADSVWDALQILEDSGLDPYLAVDCSHGNSRKDHTRQPIVFKELVRQRLYGTRGIAVLMLESHLKEGNQPIGNGPESLEYGVSITDACIGWEDTENLLLETAETLAGGVKP